MDLIAQSGSERVGKIQCPPIPGPARSTVLPSFAAVCVLCVFCVQSFLFAAISETRQGGDRLLHARRCAGIVTEKVFDAKNAKNANSRK